MSSYFSDHILNNPLIFLFFLSPTYSTIYSSSSSDHISNKLTALFLFQPHNQLKLTRPPTSQINSTTNCPLHSSTTIHLYSYSTSPITYSTPTHIPFFFPITYSTTYLSPPPPPNQWLNGSITRVRDEKG